MERTWWGVQSPVGGEPQTHGVAGAFMVTEDAASSLPHPSSPPQQSPAGQSNGLLVPSILGLFLAMGANTHLQGLLATEGWDSMGQFLKVVKMVNVSMSPQ